MVIRYTRLVLMVAAATWCRAQTPEFDVVSVKPAPPDATTKSFTQNPGGRLTTSNASLKMLIAFAYQVMPEEIAGGPPWLQSDGFDIESKAANSGVTQAQFRQMLQAFLKERFHLEAHRETREGNVFLLVQAKNGAKLSETGDNSAPPGVRIEAAGQMTGVRATMPMLANALIRPVRRKVIDETGLNGSYWFKLHYARDPNAVDADGAGSEPAIFTALQEQLGLMLKPSRRPVEVLVVDRAEKPAAN